MKPSEGVGKEEEVVGWPWRQGEAQSLLQHVQLVYDPALQLLMCISTARSARQKWFQCFSA